MEGGSYSSMIILSDFGVELKFEHLILPLQEKERDHFSQFVTESFTAYCKRKRRDKVGLYL